MNISFFFFFFLLLFIYFFFFNDTATTEIYTLSLHDALPICYREGGTAISTLSPAQREPDCGYFAEDTGERSNP